MSSTAETQVRGRIVLLLRGINVGGHRSVPMAALRSLLADELRCTEVQTYIQSGNVVCAAAAAGIKPSAVSFRMVQRFGFPVPAVVRTAQEWNALVAANPFAKSGAPAEFLHLLLLAEPLSAARLTILHTTCSGSEQIIAVGP